MRALDPSEKFIAAGTVHHTQGFIGGFYARPFGPYAKGVVHEGHAHYIDHAMELICGAVRVHWSYADGRCGTVIVEGPRELGELPTLVPVKAEASHRIEVIEEGTVWRCLFAEAEADKIEEAEGAVPYNMERADV